MHNNDWGDFGGWHGGAHRARRGDMQPIILRMLQKKPMHGYEIISSLEEKSHGMWRPSAGSVYPTLQLLEEQDLVTSELQNGKKVYSLTAAGTTAAETAETAFKAPWEEHAAHAHKFKELKMSLLDTMGMLRQIAMQDNDQKNEEVKKILAEAKDKLSKLIDDPTE
jgi:DNA-binding PadR family transcriptional regulator